MLALNVLMTIALAAPASAETLKLPKPKNPICKPPPVYIPPTVPPPRDRPKPPRPKPGDLPVEGSEPASTGVALIDEALNGKAPRSVLPIWHGYPWRKVTHPKTWTAFAAQEIRTAGRDLLTTVPADIDWHCPKYPSMTEEQRLAFWMRFISLVMARESGFNSLAIFHDADVALGIFSTGLLQLSLASAQHPKWNCDMIKTQGDLFEWRKNMACGIRIMNQLVKEDRALSYNPSPETKRSWYGLARYWGPLRDGWIRDPAKHVCIQEVIELRRDDWVRGSRATRHTSLRDSAFRKAGERKFESLLRQVNEFPYCN